MLKLLEYANTSTRPVLFLESGTMYPVRTVYQPSDVTSVVDAYNGGPIARQSFLDVGRIRTAIDRCKARFPIKAPGRKRKIYAGRSGKIRKLTNQVELEYELARRDSKSCARTNSAWKHRSRFSGTPRSSLRLQEPR